MHTLVFDAFEPPMARCAVVRTQPWQVQPLVLLHLL